MKKRAITALISAFCLFGTTVPALAITTDIMGENAIAVSRDEKNLEITPRWICEVVVDEGSSLNLRRGPSTSYSVVAKLPNGTTVTNSYLGNQGPYPDEGYFEYVTAYPDSGKIKGYVDYRYISCMAWKLKQTIIYKFQK